MYILATHERHNVISLSHFLSWVDVVWLYIYINFFMMMMTMIVS